jgi:acetoin utilization deacetylase AcuC-like enzyme
MASRLARVQPPHRTVFALEGGYDLDGLRHSARSTLRGMAGEKQFGPPLTSAPGASEAVEVASVAVARHWSI